MKIAIAREIDPSEPRVAASPDSIKKFKALGVDIAVEPGAGIKSGLPDSEFTAAGATVSPGPAQRARRCRLMRSSRRSARHTGNWQNPMGAGSDSPTSARN